MFDLVHRPFSDVVFPGRPHPCFPPLGVGLEGHLWSVTWLGLLRGAQNGAGIEVSSAVQMGRVVGLGPPPVVFATSQPSSGLRGIVDRVLTLIRLWYPYDHERFEAHRYLSG